MRIEAIRIRNLASLRDEQEAIELAERPLGEAGIIAITGSTGAGKSTILDAVCLALFGQTPRLQGRGSDPRDLLSRGAVEASVSVDLCLDDGRQWTAEWGVRRARDKVEGKLQAAQRRVIDRTTGEPLAEKIKEADELVREGLGLDFDQFTGVVLLAQGRFARFLQSESRDRAELLERLTGTELYSHLSTAAFERYKATRGKLESESAHLERLTLLPDEERKALEAEQETLDSRLRELDAAEKQTEARQRWLERSEQLRQRRLERALELERADAALTEAEPERQKLELAEKASALAAPLQALESADERAAESAQALVEAERVAEKTKAHRQDQENRLQLGLAYLERALERNRERAEALAGFSHADAEALGSLREARAELRSSRQELEERTNEHRASARALAEAERSGERIGAKAAEVERAFEQHRAAAEALLQRLQQALGDHSRDSLLARRHGLERAIELLGQWTKADPAAELARLAESRQELDRGRARAEALRTERERLTAEEEEQRQLLELARLGAEIANHRHLLQPGEPCPLCGSEDHPHAHGADEGAPDAGEDEPPAVKRALAQARAAREATKKARLAEDSHLEALRERETSAARLEASVAQLEKERSGVGERWQELRAGLPDLPEAAEKADIETLGTELDGLSERLERVETISAEDADQRERGEHLARQRGEAEQQKAVATAAVERARQDVEARKERLNEAEARQGRRSEIVLGRAQDLAEAVGLPFESNGELPRHDELEAFVDEVREGRRAWQEAREIEQRLRTLDRLQGENARKLLGDLPAAPAPRADDRDLPIEGLERRLEEVLTEASEAREREARAEQLRQGSRTENGVARARSEKAREALEKSLEGSPFVAIEDLRAARLAAETREALARRLRRLESEKERRAAEHRQSLADQAEHRNGADELGFEPAVLADRGADREAFAELGETTRKQLLEVRKELKTLHSRHVELQGRLLADDQRRQERQQLGEQLRSLEARVELTRRLDDLIGQKDGGKFRKFAQQLNLDQLLRLANLQLRRLEPRYALARIAGDLEIEVIDREMADERRPVSTLSGGETFLVSLALALALADLRRGRLELGTLFLDEGFGSLDEDTLDTALGVLEQLQATQNTQILLISHVGALQERIAHRIEVRKRGGGRSRLRVAVDRG